MTGAQVPGRRWAALAATAIALLFSALPARAHMVTTGIGPLFDGIVHSFTAFEDAIVMAAVAILAGMSGKPAARLAALVFPLAWAAGLLFGIRIGPVSLQPWLSIVSFLGLGIAIAARLRLEPIVIALPAVILALAFGWQAAADLASAPALGLFTLGSLATMSVTMILISALAVRLCQGWPLVAFRVLGSWLAAAGILLVGWTIHGMP